MHISELLPGCNIYRIKSMICYNRDMKYKFRNLDQSDIQNLVGINDENLSLLEDLYGCGIVCRAGVRHSTPASISSSDMPR